MSKNNCKGGDKCCSLTFIKQTCHGDKGLVSSNNCKGGGSH